MCLTSPKARLGTEQGECSVGFLYGFLIKVGFFFFLDKGKSMKEMNQSGLGTEHESFQYIFIILKEKFDSDAEYRKKTDIAQINCRVSIKWSLSRAV